MTLTSRASVEPTPRHVAPGQTGAGAVTLGCRLSLYIRSDPLYKPAGMGEAQCAARPAPRRAAARPPSASSCPARGRGRGCHRRIITTRRPAQFKPFDAGQISADGRRRQPRATAPPPPAHQPARTPRTPSAWRAASHCPPRPARGPGLSRSTPAAVISVWRLYL